MKILTPLAEPILHFLLIIPLLLLIKRRYTSPQLYLLLYIVLILVIDSIASSFFNLTIFSGQQWNWVGKLVTLVLAVVFINVNPVITKQEAGWTTELVKNSVAPVVIIGGIALLIRLTLKVIYSSQHHFPGIETIAFQAMLPGSAEETICRGILLALFNKLYPPSSNILGAKLGWGLITVSILFGLSHGIRLNQQLHFDINSQALCTTFGMGLIMGWLKERSGSIVPAVVFHNLWNLIVFG